MQSQASAAIITDFEVKLREMSAEDFTRISDYLQPEKTTADRLTLRSQSDALIRSLFHLDL